MRESLAEMGLDVRSIVVAWNGRPAMRGQSLFPGVKVAAAGALPDQALQQMLILNEALAPFGEAEAARSCWSGSGAS